MNYQNISLGFDIATSISIVGASVAFIFNKQKEADKGRIKFYLEELQEIIRILEKEAEEWFLLNEKISWAVAEKKELPSKYIVNIGFYTKFKCEQIIHGSSSVWLEKREIEEIKVLSIYCVDFANRFSESLSGSLDKEIIKPTEVLDKINKTVIFLTKSMEEKSRRI